MEIFKAEVKANYDESFPKLSAGVSASLQALDAYKAEFEISYFRLVSYQAWRAEVFDGFLTPGAQAFFIEAHNDAVASHVLARQGAWRVALMSLRSLIENTLYGLYYYEHPVELKLWEQGKHRLGFSEVLGYLERHPALSTLAVDVTGLNVLKDEYATLSKAVHGSSVSFRMTKDGLITGLNVASQPQLGAWLSREKNTFIALNLLMICFFRDYLCGASKLGLRKALSAVVPPAKHAKIKASTGVGLRV